MATDKVVLITGSVGVENTCIATNVWIPTPGGVNSQTINYPAVLGDSGKIVAMNGTSLTFTLPSPPPTTNWSVTVTNLNASSLTISRNGLLIDGAAANLTLTQNQGAYITTDGTNYFTSRGAGSASFSSLAGGVNTTGTFTCGTGCTINTSGSGINTATGMPFSGNTSSTNTGAAMVVGSASGTTASLVPSGVGQITGITNWLSPGGAGLFAPQPTVTGALTGGHLVTGQTLYLQLTINQGANASWPSLELAFPMNAGNNGSLRQYYVKLRD